MLRLLLLCTLAGCSFGVDSDDGASKDDPADDTSADDTSGDTDTDTDTDDRPNLSTYEGFTQAHAEAYCASLATCGYLDEQGYADVAACEAAILELLNRVPCESYQLPAAAACVDADVAMAENCADAREGMQPMVCRDVCTPPEEPAP